MCAGSEEGRPKEGQSSLRSAASCFRDIRRQSASCRTLRSRCSNSILYMPHPIERAATVSYLESIGHNYRCAILPISNITKVSYICPKSPPTDIGKGPHILLSRKLHPGNSQCRSHRSRWGLLGSGRSIRLRQEYSPPLPYGAYSTHLPRRICLVDTHITACDSCGELIFDHRETTKGGRRLCKACAFGFYYEE